MTEHIYPFLWIENDDMESIRKEILAIRKSGANAFCVESRVYPDFCGERWWRTMDQILAYTKELGMKMWLLDDKSYPTGSAAGKITDDSPLRPCRIKAENVDIEGRKGKIRMLLRTKEEIEEQDEVLGVFLVRLAENVVVDIRDMAEYVTDDIVAFEYDGVPSRLVVIMKTWGGWEKNRKNYIDMLNPESVYKLIETVYEPHYQHFVENGRYAGTFEGFFSDEPRFANGVTHPQFLLGVHHCARTVGMLGMAYPWRDGLWEQGAEEGEKLSDFGTRHMLALWYDIGQDTSAVRCAYMNVITRAYAKNFCGQLSAWCHARGLVYGGHILEDSGAHRRLSCSAGHYFRSQQGADYAAVDVVLHQIKPFYENRHIAPISGGYADPLFFNYSLAKLASSEAALDEGKEGRALCEVFGAYGWGESIQEMLFLTNHMLVRGINMFIPHAFSPIFPNGDCPPHFYGNGKNPAFEGCCMLGRYMAAMCERFSGGRAYAPVAVLYDVEGEWSGRSFADMDGVAKVLMEHQINFVFLPEDKLDRIGEYACLIVPYRQYVSRRTREQLREIGETKKVYYIPSKQQDEMEEIAVSLEKEGMASLKVHGDKTLLRVMRYDKDGKTEYFVHNEKPSACSVEVETGGKDLLLEDFLNERTGRLRCRQETAALHLEPGQAVVLTMVEHEDVKRRQKAEVRRVPVELKQEGEQEKEYYADLSEKVGSESTKKRTLAIYYQGDSIHVQVDACSYDRITSPAYVPLAQGGAAATRIKVKGNLGEKMKDNLTRFSILRPIEIEKMEIYS